MSIQRIKNNLLKIFIVVFIITFIYISLIAIFKTPDFFYNMNSIILIVGSIIIFILLYILDKRLEKLTKKKNKIISNIAFVCMGILQIVFIVFLLVHPSWDYEAINSAATKLALENTQLSEYFYLVYPNNIGSALLLGYIFKFVHIFLPSITNFYPVAFLFNMLMINSTIYLLYLFIEKLFYTSRGTLFSIFALIITPFYSYSQIVYTDTLSMLFPLAMFLILYLYTNTDNRKRKLIYLVCIGILGCIGTIIKTNVIIALISILIYLLFTNKIKAFVQNSILLLVPFLIFTTIFQTVASNYIPVPYKEAGLPYTHWVMMGLNSPYGWFSDNDVNTSKQILIEGGKQAVEVQNIQEIKNRLNNYEIVGYIKFLHTKISSTWGDGTLFAPNKLCRFPAKETFLYKYIVGDKNTIFIYISQFSFIVILISILLSAIKTYENPTNFQTASFICIFGVFLFLILWESRSRYLLCYLPVFILNGFYGLDYGFKFIDKKPK